MNTEECPFEELDLGFSDSFYVLHITTPKTQEVFTMEDENHDGDIVRGILCFDELEDAAELAQMIIHDYALENQGQKCLVMCSPVTLDAMRIYAKKTNQNWLFLYMGEESPIPLFIPSD